ncbi:hypothetical protein BH11ARM1_BH11ARM1_00320 [soil metagenome]
MIGCWQQFDRHWESLACKFVKPIVAKAKFNEMAIVNPMVTPKSTQLKIRGLTFTDLTRRCQRTSGTASIETWTAGTNGATLKSSEIVKASKTHGYATNAQEMSVPAHHNGE